MFVHRDPGHPLASVARLTELMRAPFTNPIDRLEIGRKAAEGGFSLVQLSDSHIGFAKSAKPGSTSLQPETFGFPQVSAGTARGSANLRFSGVGLSWISLDSLVRNEPFQWVTSDPGRLLF